MSKAYSQDLRDRVIDAVERGEMSRRAAARRYAISESVAIKWLERVERDGSREPVGHGGHPASKVMAHRDFLQAARTEKTDVMLQALCDRLSAERGVKADTSMMSRFFRKIGVTFKKDPRRARAGSPGHKSPPQTMAKLSGPHRSQASDLHRRDVDQDQHDPVEQFLVPTLKPGDAVILDNLGSHKGKEGRKAIRAVGARLVFLPKYSPDLNPIEQVFAKFKTLLRKAEREATRRSSAQALKSSPTTRPPNAPHT